MPLAWLSLLSVSRFVYFGNSDACKRIPKCFPPLSSLLRGIQRPSFLPRWSCGVFCLFRCVVVVPWQVSKGARMLPANPVDASIPDAPTFYPTEKQFRNPLEYVQSAFPALMLLCWFALTSGNTFAIRSRLLTRGAGEQPAFMRSLSASLLSSTSKLTTSRTHPSFALPGKKRRKAPTQITPGKRNESKLRAHEMKKSCMTKIQG